MKIIFSPQLRNDSLTLVKSGEVLTVNGDDFDFSWLDRGEILPSSAVDSDFICGDVERSEDGELTVPVILPHGANPSHAVAFPDPVTVIEDGDIVLPGGDEDE